MAAEDGDRFLTYTPHSLRFPRRRFGDGRWCHHTVEDLHNFAMWIPGVRLFHRHRRVPDLRLGANSALLAASLG